MTAAPRPLTGKTVACVAEFPFLLRGMQPIAERLGPWFATSSLEEVARRRPDIVLVNNADVIPALRQIVDRFGGWLVGLRHGAANKYIGPDPEFALADYFCGSDWDREDFARHGVAPIRKFLVTGNPWVDDIYGIPPRALNRQTPTFLFAPTYNVETSAAVFFGDQLIPSIRAVYPGSRIVIKPHPLMLNTDHPWVRAQPFVHTFERLIRAYREAAAGDDRVTLIEDASRPVSDFYSHADVLVSDGSSLIFEFMTLERPIVLYSSGRRVAKWEGAWDETAPGNAMRNVGLEFSSLDEFRRLLPGLFDAHAAHVLANQRSHSRRLYGNSRDGQAARRAAEMLAGEPDLAVLLIASPTTRQPVAPGAGSAGRLRNSRLIRFAGEVSPCLPASKRAATLARRAEAHTHALVLHHLDDALLQDATFVSRALQRICRDRVDGAGRLQAATGDCATDFASVPAWWLARDRTVTTIRCLHALEESPTAVVRFGEADADAEAGERRAAHERTSLTAFLQAIVAELRDLGVRRVAVYGAGSHTERLLPMWRELGGPDVHAVLVTEPGTVRTLLGVPVLPASRFDATSVDAIVLSSQAFEGQLAVECEERWPDVPAIPLYGTGLADHHVVTSVHPPIRSTSERCPARPDGRPTLDVG